MGDKLLPPTGGGALCCFLQVRKEKIFRPEMFARVFLFRRAFARREQNFGREPPLAGKRDDLHCLSPDGFLMRQTEFRAKKLANKRKRYGLSTSEVEPFPVFFNTTLIRMRAAKNNSSEMFGLSFPISLPAFAPKIPFRRCVTIVHNACCRRH